ncbi:hypothetical protein ACFE04_014256 [Oxalis oulophora]
MSNQIGFWGFSASNRVLFSASWNVAQAITVKKYFYTNFEAKEQNLAHNTIGAISSGSGVMKDVAVQNIASVTISTGSVRQKAFRYFLFAGRWTLKNEPAKN